MRLYPLSSRKEEIKKLFRLPHSQQNLRASTAVAWPAKGECPTLGPRTCTQPMTTRMLYEERVGVIVSEGEAGITTTKNLYC